MKSIQSTPEHDRPREKLERKGVGSLSNLELLMVILGRGMQGKDVKSLSKEILKIVENDPQNFDLKQLQSINGIGLAKASQILASFEFAKRFLIKDKTKIQNVDDIIELANEIRGKKQEHFLTLTLSGSGSLIEKRVVFKGTINQSIIHPREIFADAISDRAAGIVFVHNHPENDPEPSHEDIAITKRLVEVAQLVGIQIIDHVIVTEDEYFSFQAEGLLNHE